MERNMDLADADAKVVLLQRIVAHAFDNEDPQALLEWAQGVLPQEFAHVMDHPDPAVNARACYWLARMAWNATPLASNGFHPKPLPEPELEAPCPCGSGDSFLECCLLQDQELPSPENIWSLLATTRSDAYWVRVATAGKLPSVGVFMVVASWHERQRWRPLRIVAEAVLRAPQGNVPEKETMYLLDWLCDAYDNLHRTPRKQRRKKLALLKRFVKHESPSIRAGVNRRLAVTLLAIGDVDAAWAAEREVHRAEPEAISTALFEVTMLVAMGEESRASERAAHWREFFRDDEDNEDVLESDLDTFDAIAKDPHRVLEDMVVKGCPPQVLALLHWIDRKVDRPLPRLRWNAFGASAEDATLQGAYQLVTGRSRRVIEDEWQSVSGMKKPVGTQPFSGVELECWQRCEEWVDWLRDHTQALDSMTILDHLGVLLDSAERRIGTRNRWRAALLTRGVRIVEKHWPPDRAGTLPWALEANQPALRLLAAFIEDRWDDWEDGRLESVIRLYLRLNPDDTHLTRRHLVERLLTVGRDAEALACAARYPDDVLAQTRYGAVLALYRLGRFEEAETHLGKAQADLPLVPKYLLPDRVRRPRPSRRNVASGKLQAWSYRAAMRAVWMNTDGALEWLSEHSNKPGARRQT